MSRYDEDQLIQEAEGILGDDEHVLAAGYFALHDLVVAQIAGGTTGAVGGSLLDSTAGAALGAAFGGLTAKKALAESQGVTIQLLVAVTDTHIHVLNRDTDGRLADQVARFDRATCTGGHHQVRPVAQRDPHRPCQRCQPRTGRWRQPDRRHREGRQGRPGSARRLSGSSGGPPPIPPRHGRPSTMSGCDSA